MQELKAILIDCIPLDMPKKVAAFRMQEAENLIGTYGGLVLLKTIQKKLTPNYRTYIGSGKLEELILEGKMLGANILIINNELKPGQIWNISEYMRKEKTSMEVWDRIDLILKIFQKHAATKEAKLEIELAALKHMGPRIFGMGMELSRQGGGIGTVGIGETNTEIMKRHLKEQERKIMQELDACKKGRKLQMDARKRKNLPTGSIVGYTNAGKSSLLNCLTKKGAYVADKLFATLDTRVGKVYLPDSQQELLLSDTIGFIQDLPPTLINSFQSTLEETVHADFLLHVIDGSDPKHQEKIQVVEEMIAHLLPTEKRVIYVFNKIDQLGLDQLQELREHYQHLSPVFVSTYSKEGIDTLKQKLTSFITA